MQFFWNHLWRTYTRHLTIDKNATIEKLGNKMDHISRMIHKNIFQDIAVHKDGETQDTFWKEFPREDLRGHWRSPDNRRRDPAWKKYETKWEIRLKDPNKSPFPTQYKPFDSRHVIQKWHKIENIARLFVSRWMKESLGNLESDPLK